ncbi:MAG TPA: carboxylesterase family protein, partial [Pseudomonadales bacterium]|nr:carboxylesterase family protein [Pseudomonadales bacterium]
NIEAFGGDPNRLMLFGESAGGMSTCLLLGAPASAAFIHSAAIQSGFCSGDGNVLTQHEAESAGEKFAANAGCSSADRLNCLRKKSVRQINAALKASGLVEKPFVPSPSVPVSPVIDGVLLPKQPRDLIADGAAAGKSVIIGTNKNEGSLFGAFADKIPTEADYLALLKSQYGDHAAEVAALYPYGAYRSGRAAYADLQGDRFFTCNAKATEDALVQGGANVYAYEFVQKTVAPLGAFLSLMAPDLDYGPIHSTDVPYVFGVSSLLGNVSGARAETANLMQAYWANNATGESPNGSEVPEWPKYDERERAYRVLTTPSYVAQDLKAEKCAVLNSLPMVPL